MLRDAPLQVARFGSFELNCSTGELRKQGVRVRLEGQPLQILTMLVARPGEPVSREELREALWPDLSFGDFERNLNSAVKRLRAALDDSGHAPRYVERVRKRGYRLLVPIVWLTTHPTTDADSTRPEANAGQPPAVASIPVPAPMPASSSRMWRVALVGFLVLTVGGGAWAYGRWSGERLRKSIRSIAVLPFETARNGPSDATAYIAFGLTDAVTTALSKFGGIRVASATSAQWLGLSARTVPEIGRLLGVSAVLEGSVVQEGTRVRVTVQLVDAASDTHLWADAYTREAAGLLDLQNEIAQAVAREVRLTLEPVTKPAQFPLTAIGDPVAERAYLEGRYHASRGTTEDWELARQAFERALVRRPRHAPSLDGLASLYLASHSLPPSEAMIQAGGYAMKALSINDKRAGTHATLGIIAFHKWDWDGAMRSLERALALDPGDLRALRAHARVMGALGRTSDALSESRRAVQMDPVSIVSIDAQAHEEIQARQYDRAYETAERIIRLDPRDVRGYAQQAASSALLGNYTNCLTSAGEAVRIGGRTAPLIAVETYCLGRAGRQIDAERALAELDALAARSYVPAYFQAIAAIGVSQLDRAVKALERGHANRDLHLVDLKMSPWLDPIRGLPPVQRILDEMQFPR